MATVDVEIPEEVLTLLKGSRFGKRPVAEQVRVALAIHLFQEGIISMGKAAVIAGEPRSSFELLLGEMGIPPLRYGLEDLHRDREAFAQACNRWGASSPPQPRARRRGTLHRLPRWFGAEAPLDGTSRVQ